MRILVVGGAGYIGTQVVLHLFKALKPDKLEVLDFNLHGLPHKIQFPPQVGRSYANVLDVGPSYWHRVDREFDRIVWLASPHLEPAGLVPHERAEWAKVYTQYELAIRNCRDSLSKGKLLLFGSAICYEKDPVRSTSLYAKHKRQVRYLSQHPNCCSSIFEPHTVWGVGVVPGRPQTLANSFVEGKLSGISDDEFRKCAADRKFTPMHSIVRGVEEWVKAPGTRVGLATYDAEDIIALKKGLQRDSVVPHPTKLLADRLDLPFPKGPFL